MKTRERKKKKISRQLNNQIVPIAVKAKLTKLLFPDSRSALKLGMSSRTVG